MKKFTVTMLAMLIGAAFMLSGCGCNNDVSEKDNTEPEEIIFGENVVAVTGGYEITKDDVDMYIAMYIPYLQQQTGAEEGWDEVVLTGGKTARDTLIEYAIEEAKYQNALLTFVRDKGLYTDADDEAFYQKYIEENGGEEEYKAFLSEYGIKEEAFRKYISSTGAYYSICSEEDAGKIYDKEYISAKHILIQFEGRDSEDAAYKDALNAYNRALSGENFEDLIVELNEDPGEDPETGYTFGEGEMVDEFYKAALNLKVGEISEPVKTTYGYHIIKRYPLPEKGSDLYESYIQNIMNKVVTDFVNGEEMTAILEKNEVHINEDILDEIDLSRYTVSEVDEPSDID